MGEFEALYLPVAAPIGADARHRARLRRIREAAIPRFARNSAAKLARDSDAALHIPGSPARFGGGYSITRSAVPRPRVTVVPSPTAEAAEMVWFSFRHTRRQRYRPMPVAFLSARPL